MDDKNCGEKGIPQDAHSMHSIVEAIAYESEPNHHHWSGSWQTLAGAIAIPAWQAL
jgi:hypothetical protein